MKTGKMDESCSHFLILMCINFLLFFSIRKICKEKKLEEKVYSVCPSRQQFSGIWYEELYDMKLDFE